MSGDEGGAEHVQPAAFQQRADGLQIRVRGADLRVPNAAYRRLLRLERVFAGASSG